MSKGSQYLFIKWGEKSPHFYYIHLNPKVMKFLQMLKSLFYVRKKKKLSPEEEEMIEKLDKQANKIKSKFPSNISKPLL